jgi:thioredoxin-like negative regulator of GroEL
MPTAAGWFPPNHHRSARWDSELSGLHAQHPGCFRAAGVLGVPNTTRPSTRTEPAPPSGPTEESTVFVLRSLLPSTRRWWLASAAVVVGIAVWCSLGVFAPQSAESLLKRARSVAEQGDLTAARAFAREAAQRAPNAAEPWLLIAHWSLQTRDFAAAVDAWEHVPPDSPSALETRLRAAETCLRQMRHLRRAERLYREASTLSPNNVAAVEGLAQTLAIEGRWSELATCVIRLIQLDAYSNFHLDLLVRGPDLNVDPQLLPPVVQTAPDDIAARCAHIRLAMQSGDESRARKDLEAILKGDAASVQANLMLGRLLLSQGADDDLRDWLQTAPAALRNESDYWRVALIATQRGHDEAGELRCAWEVLSRDPNDIAACLSLGRGLHRLGEADLAAGLTERAARLERYAAVVSSARRPKNWDAIQQAVELAESLGLSWEAWGWCRLASRLNPALTWPQATLDRLAPRIAQLELVRTDPATNPVRRLNAERFAAPRFDTTAPELSTPVEGALPPRLAFREDALRSGLNFEYHNGGDCLRTGLRRMYEFTGGGVGVVDFDRDGYPDLYFPTGGEFSQRGQPMTVVDRLWQNLSGESWRDVTELAGFSDQGFGQGVCAGDVDNDGFPDLLVLNIGTNVLWRNCGDGTFKRSQEFAAVTRDAWSLSAAIADLDGDSQPDIYVVNYLAGDDVFTRVCPDSRGINRLTCQPLVFSAAPDQLLRGLGDDRFEDRSATAGIDRPEGRGMGLVVGRITQPDELDVYVANDATANFHFVREHSPDRSERHWRYADEAFLRGTAVDSTGRAQASMGLAANDADGDGRLDLFVTNFEGESTTLYVQQSDGLLSDRSQEFQLTALSRGLLGFGTQFLDADLDGHPELIVANGHVNDRRDSGSLYQMPPQLFRNRAGRGFELVPPPEAGSYFGGEYLGRGLAVLDWNRDGRPDAVVSHLDRPAALLTNESERGGRWLQVRCIGTTSARDAIGTTVSVSSGQRRIVRQLTAGDGYASSNQRDIFLGTGPLPTETVTLEVSWPSGETVELTDVPLDCEVVIIEGRLQAIPLSRVQPASDLVP